MVTEENSGRKQESLVATSRQNAGRLHLSAVCCGNSSGTKSGVSQEDVRGDIKDVRSGLKVLDPIPICVCMWWFWFSILPSNSQVQLGVLQLN